MQRLTGMKLAAVAGNWRLGTMKGAQTILFDPREDVPLHVRTIKGNESVRARTTKMQLF